MNFRTIFNRFPNPAHIGEIFTPEEYVLKAVHYLSSILPASKNTIVIDPCAGLGQFEYYLQDYYVIANEIERDNCEFISKNVTVDCLNNVDSLSYSIPENISAVITNPPYSGHINNGKAKREELWMSFVVKYFLESKIGVGIFIVPCKWMTSPYFHRLLKFIQIVDVLDSSKFLLRESKWSSKNGVSARIMSGVCILVLNKNEPTNIVMSWDDNSRVVNKDILNIGILPVNRQLNIEVSCRFISKFINLTDRYGSMKERFLSQYHFEIHSKNQTSNEIPLQNIYQSRRKRLLNKPIDPSRFRKNTHYNDYKCILSTSNECWNGYIFNFPVTLIGPEIVYSANYMGFWGSKDECECMQAMFQSKEFNAMLSMIKQTQNFNSNYLWCTPLIINKEDLHIFFEELQEYTDFINAFNSEVRRAYDKSRFFKE